MELSGLVQRNDSRIVFVVMDGLGGLPVNGRTELEAASTPTMDSMVREAECGLVHPVAPGITPGSGPGHLALFGYDPFEYEIGRGILSALGVGFEIEPGDVACRINFATVDEQGNVVDRRAGRIPTSLCVELCELLSTIRVEGAEVFVRPEKEHRAAVIFRGGGLSGELLDTDPQKTGVPPLPVRPASDDEAAVRTAAVVTSFVEQAFKLLSGRKPANAILMRGFDKYHPLPTFDERYGLNAACIATYPMYKGVARLVGMKVYEEGQESVADEFAVLERHWSEHDYFFLHVKKTDSYGEDGNFDAKVKVIEEVDSLLDRLLALKPSVAVITADHSTPSVMKAHSFHPVPLMLWGDNVRPDGVETFGERAVAAGALTGLRLKEIMPLALAHAGKLKKFGA